MMTILDLLSAVCVCVCVCVGGGGGRHLDCKSQVFSYGLGVFTG